MQWDRLQKKKTMLRKGYKFNTRTSIRVQWIVPYAGTKPNQFNGIEFNSFLLRLPSNWKTKALFQVGTHKDLKVLEWQDKNRTKKKVFSLRIWIWFKFLDLNSIDIHWPRSCMQLNSCTESRCHFHHTNSCKRLTSYNSFSYRWNKNVKRFMQNIRMFCGVFPLVW